MNVAIVIPSARASNLVPCVQSILRCEPALEPSSIIVVDDGARTDAEARLPSVRWVTGVQPFVFARNVNLGIRVAGTADVILLNDDARLLTPYGLTDLAAGMQRESTIGVCSAGVHGTVCNPRQRAGNSPSWREEPDRLAFVCVYIPRAVIARVGLLDERFTGYGFEDFDYCRRVREAGFRLMIWDGCVVSHLDGSSTYRTNPDVVRLLHESQALYHAKWAGAR